MRDKPFYELLSRIDDDSLLANFFNKVLGNLDMARIISAPVLFVIKMMKIADIALIFL